LMGIGFWKFVITIPYPISPATIRACVIKKMHFAYTLKTEQHSINSSTDRIIIRR
jgi:hypothetical protein